MMEWRYIFVCKDCEIRQGFRTQGERDSAVTSHLAPKRGRKTQDNSGHKVEKLREAV